MLRKLKQFLCDWLCVNLWYFDSPTTTGNSNARGHVFYKGDKLKNMTFRETASG